MHSLQIEKEDYQAEKPILYSNTIDYITSDTVSPENEVTEKHKCKTLLPQKALGNATKFFCCRKLQLLLSTMCYWPTF